MLKRIDLLKSKNGGTSIDVWHHNATIEEIYDIQEKLKELRITSYLRIRDTEVDSMYLALEWEEIEDGILTVRYHVFSRNIEKEKEKEVGDNV